MPDANPPSEAKAVQPPPGTLPWAEMLNGEHSAINKRRPKARPVTSIGTLPGKAYGDSGHFDTVGLALSGGGIRSAAFCLGAVQALAEHDMIDCIDYLSTVSGGGYTGAAISSYMSLKDGAFPFKGEPDDFKDPLSLWRIRDYSNYLIPRASGAP